MKVLFVIDTLEPGGAEISLLEILRRRHLIEPTLCHIYRGSSLKTAFESSCVPVVSFDLACKYGFGRAGFKLRSLVRQVQPDLIYTVLTRSNIVGRTLGRVMGIPVISNWVSESYGRLRMGRLGWTSRLKLRTVQALDALTCRWCVHFVANSEAVRKSNCRALRVPRHKVSVVYRGRDPKPLMATKPDVELRLKLTLAEDTKVILNVGRLTVYKGQAELIQILPLIKSRFRSIRLLIAGEGPQRSELERLAAELKVQEEVSLLGYRSDVPDLLALSDVFVFPSSYEGHPGVLLEAMLAAVPIAATDIAVHRETLEAGRTGVLFPADHGEALAEAVIWMLEHPVEAREMGNRARADALQRFTVDRMSAEHERVCEEALQRLAQA